MPSDEVIVMIICGLPGSGKTFLCEKLCSYRQNNYHIHNVNFDSHITCSIANNRRHLIKEKRMNLIECIFKRIDSFLSNKIYSNDSNIYKFENALLLNLNYTKKNMILLDDNFVFKSMRQQVNSLCYQRNIIFGEIFVNCPLEECLIRNNSRSNPVESKSIIQMSRNIDYDQLVNRKSLVLNGTEYLDIDNVWNKILCHVDHLSNLFASKLNEIDKKEQSKLANDNNIIHNVDIFLRKFINQLKKTTFISTTFTLLKKNYLMNLKTDSSKFKHIDQIFFNRSEFEDFIKNDFLEFIN